MSTQDWSAFACPNPDCPTYGHKGQGHLRPHGWSSKQQGIRCLRCTRCGKNFSQRAGTDHPWSMAEILTYPLFPARQRPENAQPGPRDNERPEGG
jgi:hypothetical protein